MSRVPGGQPADGPSRPLRQAAGRPRLQSLLRYDIADDPDHGVALYEAIVSQDTSRLSDDGWADRLEAIQRAKARLAALEAETTAGFDDALHGVSADLGHRYPEPGDRPATPGERRWVAGDLRSVADELALILNLGKGHATARIHTSCELVHNFRATLHALREGWLTERAAFTIVRELSVLDDLDDLHAAEAAILDWARTHPLVEIKQECRRETARRSPAASDERHRRGHDERSVRMFPDGDGRATLVHTQDAVGASAVMTSLSRSAARHRRNGDTRTMDQLRADIALNRLLPRTKRSATTRIASTPANTNTYEPANTNAYRPADSNDCEPADATDYGPPDGDHYEPAGANDFYPADSNDCEPADAKDYRPAGGNDRRPADAAAFRSAQSDASGNGAGAEPVCDDQHTGNGPYRDDPFDGEVPAANEPPDERDYEPAYDCDYEPGGDSAYKPVARGHEPVDEPVGDHSTADHSLADPSNDSDHGTRHHTGHVSDPGSSPGADLSPDLDVIDEALIGAEATVVIHATGAEVAALINGEVATGGEADHHGPIPQSSLRKHLIKTLTQTLLPNLPTTPNSSRPGAASRRPRTTSTDDGAGTPHRIHTPTVAGTGGDPAAANGNFGTAHQAAHTTDTGPDAPHQTYTTNTDARAPHQAHTTNAAAGATRGGPRIELRITDQPPPSDPDRYTPSAALDRYVRLRDRTCQFPGCNRPAEFTDLDHRIPFAAGGRTTAANLWCLCRHHHRLKHEGGWVIHPNPDGTWTWISPTGRRYRNNSSEQHALPGATDEPASPNTGDQAAPPTTTDDDSVPATTDHESSPFSTDHESPATTGQRSVSTTDQHLSIDPPRPPQPPAETHDRIDPDR